MKTYLVTVEIRDGDNEYLDKSLVEVQTEHPTDELFIKEIYGDIPYDNFNKSWDIGYGAGYPLVRVSSWQEVKPEHIEILRYYGVC